MSDDWLRRVSPVIHGPGVGSFGKGIINPWRRIDDYELLMFAGGSARMMLEGEDYSFDREWFVIIPPATRHISYCLSDSVDVYWCHFNWLNDTNWCPPGATYYHDEVIEGPVAAVPSFLPEERMVGELPSSYVLEIHKRMARMWHSGDPHERSVSRSLLLQVLLELLSVRSERPAEKGTAQEVVEAARQRLTAVAHLPFSKAPAIAEVLEEFGSSYFHLERLFKECLGITPGRYISLIRVERARSFLREGQVSVGECAAQLGFRDVGYFIRFFRKHTGTTPAAYQRTN